MKKSAKLVAMESYSAISRWKIRAKNAVKKLRWPWFEVWYV